MTLAVGALWAAPAHATSFCGTPALQDRTPELFGGPQIHTAYVRPSDWADRLTSYADAIETNAEAIDAWWRGQDPTRAPRFDQFAFPCGPQLDLATVELQQTGDQLVDTTAAFSAIAGALQPIELLGSDDYVVVYYDGPASNQSLCGLGGSGLAVVFVDSCAGADSARVAAHELGHALGAVPNGAPHLCPGSGHTCDDPNDLMYPYVNATLASAILDPGHDDWYGHSGSWFDVQDSPFLKHVQEQVHLTVGLTGAGEVTSEPTGVDCTATCGQDWDAGSEVHLTAGPADGLRFVRWTGACSGGNDCTVTLDQSKSVAAFFAPATFRLSVAVTGRGRVVSRPPGIACTKTCRHAFTSYRPVLLTAKPPKGWRFRAWSGVCRGAALTCRAPMTKATAVAARFVRKRT